MSNDTETVTIDTSGENTGPTIEESYEALKKEGVITDDETPTGEPQGETQGAPEEEAQERPEGLPEKFKSVEDMAKAYAELEKKQSQGGSKDETKVAEADAEADKVVEKAGLNMEDLTAEFSENGELGDKSYAALEKAGIPRAMVDAYIEGINAQNAIFETEMKAIAGGEEAYGSLLKWGEGNLSDEEIDAFDVAVNSGNKAAASVAIKGLMAQMKLAEGEAPQRTVSGEKTAGGGVYESYAQMEADMNDPRYETDEAFRQKVYAKLGRSNL